MHFAPLLESRPEHNLSLDMKATVSGKKGRWLIPRDSVITLKS